VIIDRWSVNAISLQWFPQTLLLDLISVFIFKFSHFVFLALTAKIHAWCHEMALPVALNS